MPITALADAGVARQLEALTLAESAFTHRGHLQAAWAYLNECGSVDEAGARMGAALRAYAASLGKGDRYHETITRVWMRLVAAAALDAAAGCDAAAILAAHPELLDKDLPLAYYSRERLFGDEARRGWVEPDRRPLPSHGSTSGSRHSPRDAPDRPVSRRSR